MKFQIVDVDEISGYLEALYTPLWGRMWQVMVKIEKLDKGQMNLTTSKADSILFKRPHNIFSENQIEIKAIELEVNSVFSIISKELKKSHVKFKFINKIIYIYFICPEEFELFNNSKSVNSVFIFSLMGSGQVNLYQSSNTIIKFSNISLIGLQKGNLKAPQKGNLLTSSKLINQFVNMLISKSESADNKKRK